MQDFVCHASSNPTPHPLFKVSEFDHLSPAYQASLFNVLSTSEPSTYVQVRDDPRWVEVMQNEIAVLETNDTWEVVDLPPIKRSITSKWVYRIKHKPDGTVDRFKARFVVRGFDQIKVKDTPSPLLLNYKLLECL